MGRSTFALIFFLFASVSVFGQKCALTVLNELRQPVTHITLFDGISRKVSNINGVFEINCAADSLDLRAEGYDSYGMSRKGSFPDTIILFHSSKAMDEVTITKERLLYFDIGYLPPLKGVQIVTGTSSIIQLEKHGGAKSSANPRELFAKIPGLNIWESDGAGIQMGVGGRGLSPNRAANFNMRQNGYDISADALGYPESYYTPPLEALQSVEIIRGSASLQYGTQFGGLMNFVFKDPNPISKFDLIFRNTVGNMGYYGNFTRISGTNKRWSYQAYYQLKTGNGWRPNSDFSQHQGFAQFSYQLNEKQRVRLEYTKMYYLAQQPGGLTDKQFEDDAMQSNRTRNWFSVDWNILALHYDFQINKSLLFNFRSFGMISERNALGFLGKINQADPMGQRDLIHGTFKNAGAEARLMKQYEVGQSRGGLLFGARFYKGQTTGIQGLASDGSDADFTYNNPDSPENSAYDFPSLNTAFFAENIFFLGPKWTVNTGFRLDYIKSAANGSYKQYIIHELTLDTLAIKTYEESNSLSRVVPLAGFGSSFKISKRTSVYTNFCMNYRAVNFSDIRVVNPNVIVDSAIRDEYGSTTELGWRGFLGKYFYVDVAGFYIFYGNKIGIAPYEAKKIRTNIGDARNMGVEFFTEFDILKMVSDSSKCGLSTFINFSYINSKYIRSREANYVGNSVEYVSPVILRSGIKFRTEKFQIQVQGSYNAEQYSDASNAYIPSGDAVIGIVPEYFVFDLSTRYTINKNFQVEGGINNLTNEIYFSRRATAYPGPGILPSDGRYFYLTLQFRCNTK